MTRKGSAQSRAKTAKERRATFRKKKIPGKCQVNVWVSQESKKRLNRLKGSRTFDSRAPLGQSDIVELALLVLQKTDLKADTMRDALRELRKEQDPLDFFETMRGIGGTAQYVAETFLECLLIRCQNENEVLATEVSFMRLNRSLPKSFCFLNIDNLADDIVSDFDADLAIGLFRLLQDHVAHPDHSKLVALKRKLGRLQSQ